MAGSFVFWSLAKTGEENAEDSAPLSERGGKRVYN
jgi:hypothetical protein